MPDLNAILEQLKSAGIAPQVQIVVSTGTPDVQQVSALVEALKTKGITPEVRIDLQVSTDDLGVPPSDPSQDKQKTFTVVVNDKLNCMEFTRKDAAGKPIMEIHEPRIQLFKGTRFQVSATHKASDRDAGDGTVIGTGGMKFYWIADCPANRAAEGFYVRQSEVSRV
jgi:hypothetical protein